MVCVGVDHATAPLAIRERLARALAQDDPALASLSVHLGGACEYAWLVTCNRVELYAVLAEGNPSASRWARSAAHLLTIVADATDDGAQVRTCMRTYVGDEADMHLCRVAAGLESMVLGEAEILGQVSQAITRGRDAGTAGDALLVRFGTALRAGRRARAETSLGHHAASVSSIAVQLADARAPNDSGNRALVIGVGKMGRSGAARLLATGRWSVDAARRSTSSHEEGSGIDGVSLVPPDQLCDAIARADVVFAAANADELVVDVDTVRDAIAARPHRPLLVIDVGVPRNVDAAVGGLPGVTLVDLDALQARAAGARERRRLAVPAVEAIIAEELQHLERRTRGAELLGVVQLWRREAEQVRRHAIDQLLDDGTAVSPEVAQQLERLSVTLVNRLLEAPTRRLREEAGNGHAEAYADMARRIFARADDASSHPA